VVGGVKEPPTEASSSLLLKVWSRLDTGRAPVQDLVTAAVRTPSFRAAGKVPALRHEPVRTGDDDLVVRKVVNLVAPVAFALSAGLGVAWLYGHLGILLILLGSAMGAAGLPGPECG
jgi:hypothetical protein